MRECPECATCYEDDLECCPTDAGRLRPTLEGPRELDRRYLLEKRIAHGGMGVVYIARHLNLQRVFALKIIQPGLGWQPAQVARFRLEAETLGRLKHPHIVDVTDYGVDPRGDGLPYLVMELLAGRSLAEYGKKEGPLAIADLLPILQQVAAAVDFAHSRGVLHRDVKPANVLIAAVEGGPCAKLLDFGLAKGPGSMMEAPGGSELPEQKEAPGSKDGPSVPFLADPELAAETATGVPALVHGAGAPKDLAGTPQFMGPECFLGRPATRATDIYAFGAMTYLMLTGKHPFEGSVRAIIDGHLHRDPPRPSSIGPGLAPALDDVVLHALAKDPDHRPTTCRAYVAALETEAHRIGVLQWKRREGPRRLVIAGLIAGAMLATTVIGRNMEPLQALERYTVDRRLAMLPRRSPDPRIALVLIDEASVAKLGIPLGSREMADELSRGVERLVASGARAVALDLLVPRPWGTSEAFSSAVLRHRDALTLAAYVSASGTIVGPETLEGFTAAAMGPDGILALFGVVNTDEDGDGVVRHARLAYPSSDGGAMASWGAHAARHLTPISLDSTPVRKASFVIDAAVDPARFERIPWSWVEDHLRNEPFAFRDRLVLVGADLPDSGDDVHRLGFEGYVPGIVVQAMIVNTILGGFRVQEIGYDGAFARGGLGVAWWLLATLILTTERPRLAALSGSAAALVAMAASHFSFIWTAMLVPVVVPGLLTLLLAAVCLGTRAILRPFPSPPLRRIS